MSGANEVQRLRLRLEVESGRGGEARYEVGSVLELIDSLSPEPAQEFWQVLGGGPGTARDEFADLAERLGPPPTPVVPVDWQRVEQDLGLSLPSDYKSFVDTYGAGTICDVRISAPGAPGKFDQLDLLRRKYEQVIRTGASEFRPPIFPERLGVITWGESSQTCTLGWLPDPVANPDSWGVTISAPQPPWLSAIGYHPDLSFSSFLLLLYRSPEEIAIDLYRDVWEGEVRFSPVHLD